MKILKNLLFAGCYNGNIYVYNIHAHERLGEITGPGGMLLSMDIFENKVKIWFVYQMNIIYIFV